jgi:Mg2+-importing ATPase
MFSSLAAFAETRASSAGPKASQRIEAATSRRFEELSRQDAAQVLEGLGSSESGLTAQAAEAALEKHGPNIMRFEDRKTVWGELLGRAKNPLNALLFTLAIVSWLLGDQRAAIVILVMIVLSVALGFVQEHRSNQAAAKLRAMVRTTATVRRQGAGEAEIPIEHIVPGDIVLLSAGDAVPADIRLLSAKDLLVNQSALTGEAMPAEKTDAVYNGPACGLFDLPNMCAAGSNVVSGMATAVVVETGQRTYFGQLAESISEQRVLTSFDKGINRFTWLMIRFIMVMVPAVFVINGLTKGNWLEALLFAVAVAVGLTPEMLPMIVTVNLAKGAIAMSRKRVIVKRLNAIQNFGAMDVLCTDKTGTLTQDRIILKRCLDLNGKESRRVLEYAYLNSHYQLGIKNLLDIAVLEHAELKEHLKPEHLYKKIDELPFDFQRRRLSVVLEQEDGQHILICKGAVEEVFQICTNYRIDGETGLLDRSHFERAREEMTDLNMDGFRVVAVAYKEIAETKAAYELADEAGLTLAGFIAFLDPPKESAREAIAALNKAGVAVKILTGDNDIVTAKVCSQVGLRAAHILLGTAIDKLSDDQLAAAAVDTTVFAKVSPQQKARVIKALQRKQHVVGFLGDGINDSLALKAADVGISVDTAVDVAKESADIILLEKSLLVLREGVIEGRKIFANITKYIRMGASSNFGNMFSVLGASIFLPFLPMQPIQVLTNNLLYDFSQTTIPTDNVDGDYLKVPRRWDIENIFKFMIFIGPISSVFDYVTYFTMLYVFGAWDKPSLFQTGWFVESIITQTLIIHIIRTPKIPFLQSRASDALIATTIIICMTGMILPFTGAGEALGFVPLPALYWPLLFVIVTSYATLTHFVKIWFVRRWGT